jgi:hypothetical protein
MKLLLSYKTLAGTFYIGQSQEGRFHHIFHNENLGRYAEIWQATEVLSNDITFSVFHPDTGQLLNISKLGIPKDHNA